MATNYEEGLKREVVAMKQRGHTQSEIMRSLRINNDFYNQAIKETPVLVRNTWEPEYEDINEIGGY